MSKLFPRVSFYGWIALAGAMLVYFCGCGNIFYAYGVFMPSMIGEFGWSRVAFGGAFSLFFLLSGMPGPLIGASIVRFGPRANIIVGNALAALGLAALFFTSEPWQLYLFYGVFVGLGNGFGMFAATTTIANNWFIRRRSLAMGLTVAAGGLGGLAFPPLITMLISFTDWRAAWVVLAFTHLVLAVVVGGLILIRDKPENLGQLPDGVAAEAQEGSSPGVNTASRVYQTAVDWETGQAMRRLTTWLMVIFGSANIFALNVMNVHQVAHLKDIGFSPIVAATALGLLPGMSIIGRLGFGALADRIEPRYLAAACLTLQAVAVIILLNARDLPLIYLYAIIFGICYGGLIVSYPTMLGAYYGRARYAQILGWMLPAVTAMGAIGGPLAGAIHDATNTYSLAFMVVVAFSAIGAACAFLARPPKPPLI